MSDTKQIFLPAKIIAGLIAIYFIIGFFAIAINRLWDAKRYNAVEDSMAHTIYRVARDLPVYAEPNVEFTSTFYGPVYPYAASLFRPFFGDGLAAPRLLSILSIAACFFLIRSLVFTETRSPFAGLLAAGCFASFYGFLQLFFDLASVDGLQVCLLLFSALQIRLAKNVLHMISAALFMVLAVLTQQTAFIPLVLFGLWAVLYKRRLGIVFFAGAGALVLGSHLFYQWYTGGWFYYYFYEVFAAHKIMPDLIKEFFIDDFGIGLGVGVLLWLYWALCYRHEGKAWLSESRVFYLVLFLAFFMMAFVNRIHSGSVINNLLPLCAAMAIGVGLSIHNAAQRSRVEGAVIVSLISAFMLQHFYQPQEVILLQSMSSTAASEEMFFRNIPPPVFAPSFGFSMLNAGKNSTASWAAMKDVLATSKGRALSENLNRSFREQKYVVVVLDPNDMNSILNKLPDLFKHYRTLRSQDRRDFRWLGVSHLGILIPKPQEVQERDAHIIPPVSQ